MLAMGEVSQTRILDVSCNFRCFILHFKYVYLKNQFGYNSIQSILGVEKSHKKKIIYTVLMPVSRQR